MVFLCPYLIYQWGVLSVKKQNKNPRHSGKKPGRHQGVFRLVLVEMFQHIFKVLLVNQFLNGPGGKHSQGDVYLPAESVQCPVEIPLHQIVFAGVVLVEGSSG